MSSQYGITRKEALALMNESLQQENLKKHCLASEAVMQGLATKFDQDPDLWGLIGRLQDLEYDSTKDHMDRHGLETARILEEMGVSPLVTEPIIAHNADQLGRERSNPVDFAITAGETITGLITAVTLVYPDKRIRSVKLKSVTKRMKDSRFAQNVSREKILLCKKLDLELNDFIQLALDAMCGIDEELGLA